MNSPRSLLGAVVCALLLAACLAASVWQLSSLGRHLSAWRRQHESVPAYGAAPIVYFHEPTCPACRIVSPSLDKLARRFPRYRLARVNTASPAGIALHEEYVRAYRLPATDQARIPVVFAGRRAFIGVDAITRDLPAYLNVQAPATLALPPLSPEPGSVTLVERFQRFRVLPVLVAGLVDSINPCAIATLIFFLSCLAWAGRGPRDLLWVGGSFTLGVFLTYFLIGLGLLGVLKEVSAIPVLSRAVYPLSALLTLALAAISFRDFASARRGETRTLSLQMPRAVQRKVHRVLRAGVTAGGNAAHGGDRPDATARAGHSARLAFAAFVAAMLVSILEFICTSQVYLPTLIYMVQEGSERLRATTLLLLYNLMFILPLVALLVAAYFGASSRLLARLAARHVATAKLLMSLFFAGSALYLGAVSLRMLGHG